MSDEIKLGRASDVKINLSEFKGGVHKSEATNSVFEKFDKNKDGKLDEKEMQEMQGFIKNTAKNGTLTKGELKRTKEFGKDSEKVFKEIETLYGQQASLNKNGSYLEKMSDGSSKEIYANDVVVDKDKDGEIVKRTWEDSSFTLHKYSDDKTKFFLENYSADNVLEQLKSFDQSGDDRYELSHVTSFTYGEDGSRTELVKDPSDRFISETKYDKENNVVNQEVSKAKEEIQQAEPEQAKLHSYTVQNGESFTGLIKKSLVAQGVEKPTKEEMAKAIADFKENNPGAVKKAKNGVEFLQVGAKVKLSGELEDKDNAKEQIGQYTKSVEAKKAAEPTGKIDAETSKKEAEEKNQKEFAIKNPYIARPDENAKKPEQSFTLSGNEKFKTKFDATKEEIPWVSDIETPSGKLLSRIYDSDQDGKADLIYEYDANGNRTKTVYKDANGKISATEEYTHDANGNRTKEVYKDANGKISATEEYTRDANGNMTKEVYKDANGKTTSTFEYTYDTNGNRTKKVGKDADGSNEWTYDTNGNMTKEVDKDGKGNITKTTEYTYDVNGNKTKEVVKDADGKIIN